MEAVGGGNAEVSQQCGTVDKTVTDYQRGLKVTEISLDDLFNTYTTQEQIKASFENRTVATGRYTFLANKAQAEIASDMSKTPGRKQGNFFGQLKDDSGKRVGSVGFNASWEVMHTTDKNGHKRQDKSSSLWGQLVTALDLKTASVADVIKAAGSYPLSVYLNEAFQTPEGWRTAKTPEQRADYRKAGYESKNFVESVSRVK
jgi:hypothetical protein